MTSSNIDGADLVEKDQFHVVVERICSIPSVNESTSIEEEPNKMKVNVSVTVVSVAGIHIHDCSKPKLKGFMPKRNISHNREQSSSKPTSSTTITASFSRRDGEMEKDGTAHVASLPVQLGGAFSSSSATIYWPDQDGLSSSHHFQQVWPQEREGDNNNGNESVVKPCTVHLAVANSGRTFNLGRAEILSDKVGESFIDIPIIDELPSASKQSRFIKSNRVKMMKLDGVGLKCGLGSNVMLKVKVQVSEPFYDDPKPVAVAVPPSRVRSPLRVRSIRKTFSSSTGSYSHSTNTTSKMSSESSQGSMDWGVEIQYNTVPPSVSPSTNHSTESIQMSASVSEASMDSYASAASDFVSSLGEDQSFIEYDKGFSWHEIFRCIFPVCGEMKQECTDIQFMKSQALEAFEAEEEPSRSSFFLPW